ncbi:MAG: hypothetical protein CVT79_11390 [Alphaproteobacteria bacterium HGW-Alphaproteobacteria-18]|nr:MAG: hypothetical protein CVT79_11390 [Alphaproteobacteria bacterium HGW-Alphaproteobacteria-18]
MSPLAPLGAAWFLLPANAQGLAIAPIMVEAPAGGGATSLMLSSDLGHDVTIQVRVNALNYSVNGPAFRNHDPSREVRRAQRYGLSALALPVEARVNGEPVNGLLGLELLGPGLVCPVGFEGRVYCSVAEEGDTVAVTTPSGRFVEAVASVRGRGEMRLRPGESVRLAGID